MQTDNDVQDAENINPKSDEVQPELPSNEESMNDESVETIENKTSGDELTTESEENAKDGALESSTDVGSTQKSSKPSKLKRLLPKFVRNLFAHHPRIVTLLTIVIIVGLGVGGVFGYQHFGKRKQPVVHFSAVVEHFKVISTTPLNDQQNVASAKTISVLFNRPVDPAKMNGDFFVSPTVEGTYAVGASTKEVVFTPKLAFPEGTVVKVMIHGEFQSLDGSQLGADYTFGFTTLTPNNQVLFNRNYYNEILGSAPSNQEQTYNLFVGQDVDTSGDITIYKSNITSLLSSLVYSDKVNNGYTYESFVTSTLDTSSMTSIKTQKGLKDTTTFKVTEPKGIYAIVASAGGKQIGFTWLVVSDYGVIIRQDDKQMVLAAQDLTNSTPVKVDATLYSLKDSKKELGQVVVDGVTTTDTPYKPKVDVVVAANGDDYAVVPVNELMSMADLRVQQDLSVANKTFAVTDRTTYGIGDTVKYSGFVRTDNDAAYDLPNSGQMTLYVAAYPGGAHYAEFVATIDGNGQIGGSFKTTTDFITSGQTSQQLNIYEASGEGVSYRDQPIAAFNVTSVKQSSYAIKVSFAKPEFLANEKVTALVNVTKADGTPLANTTVNVDEYSKQYYENNPSANQAALDTVGTKVVDQPTVVTLDANGNGSFAIDTAKLPAGNSQIVTVQASKTDDAGAVAGGGASTIIHLGDGTLEFGPARTLVTPNSKVVAKVYAKTLDNKPLTGVAINYALVTDNKQIASGVTSSDNSGTAGISQVIGAVAVPSSIELDVWSSDSQNNKIQAKSYYYVQNSTDSGSFSDLQLSGLGISGSSKDVSVGDTLNLVIDAPHAIHALVTLERGRIHKSEAIDLKAGSNKYIVKVTADLAPSFSLAFSYFDQAKYRVEGLSFNASPIDKQAAVKLSPDKQTYVAGDTATIKIATSAAQKGLKTNLIVGIVDANIYNLYDQPTPDMFTYLYSPREITTNSASSLTSLGSGGGKCGGGIGDIPSLTSPVGSTLLWEPSLTTNSAGEATVQVKLPKGSWRAYVYSMSVDGIVGSATTTLTAK